MKHVFVILDRSGSMESVKAATIDGYNEYLNGLRNEADVRWNLVLFDDRFEYPIEDQPVRRVKALTRRSYVPRGMTALIDAICMTLTDAQDQVREGDKALVVIITDGLENASKEYRAAQMRKLIQKLESRKNWTFTYLGANQDAWHVAKDWGFHYHNVGTFNATGAGIGETFSNVSASSANMLRSQGMATQDFFSKDQKDKMERTK